MVEFQKYNKYFLLFFILNIKITIEDDKKFRKSNIIKYHQNLKYLRLLQIQDSTDNYNTDSSDLSGYFNSDSIENSNSDSTEYSNSDSTQNSNTGTNSTDNNSKNPSDSIEINPTISSDSTNDSTGNVTFGTILKKSDGLSTGAIIAIVIPCFVAVIGAVAVIALCSVSPKPPINPVINNTTGIPTMIESSMEELQVGPNPPPVEVVTQPQIQPQPRIVQEIIHPANIVYKESPQIPQVNRVFEPMYPVKKVIPVQQVVEIKQSTPQISQVSQVMAFPQNSQIGTSQNVSQVVTSQNMSQVVTSPQISQIIKTQKVSQIIKPQLVSQVNLPDPEPVHYISESKIISESQVLPEISTSQISASKVLPLKVIPQITRTNEVLPMKVLPTIDQGTFESTYVENIPQITQIKNNNINVNQSVKPVHSSQISENLLINNSINNLNSKNNE